MNVRRWGHGVGTAVAVVGVVATAHWSTPPAYGVDPQLALNGIYVAVSIGEWAKKNEVYFDQATVRSTWTMNSVCTDPDSCTGTVVSDQGWSAELTMRSSMWTVRRDVPDWIPCPDGSTYPGRQLFRFAPVGADGRRLIGADVLAAEDVTAGPAGACGVGQPLVIRMPFRLEKVG